MKLFNAKYLLIISSVFFLQACGSNEAPEATESTSDNSVLNNMSDADAEVQNGEKIASVESGEFKVYKSPTCGCCKAWVNHAEKNGLNTKVVESDNLVELKAKLGISPQYRSCHTVVSNQGYVFEGHVPAKLVKKFLEEKPANALGLAVPGMPMGSPGMENGDQFDPYDVVLLKKDGSSEVYARIENKEDQY